MEVKAENQGSDSSVDSAALSKLVRNSVINNSQIINAVIRTSLILTGVTSILGMWVRSDSAGSWRETLRIVAISLVAVSGAFMILGQFLDRALRRCPICRTRITSKTEEKRRCLECDTELWG
jgi:hypothetical protein